MPKRKAGSKKSSRASIQPKRPTLERDVYGEPKPTHWLVTFTMQRTFAVNASNAKDAEHIARDAAPIEGDEITNTHVAWVDLGVPPDLQVMHLEGCWGNHCRHYDCETDECASNYDEYCSQCEL